MQARTATRIAEGLVAGVVAHVAIAFVLGLADFIAGRWILYTPALLGSVLLEGGGEGCQIPLRATSFLAYTSIHLITLTLFGLAASWLVRGSEERPILWFGALLTFVMLAWHLPAPCPAGVLTRIERLLVKKPSFRLCGRFAGNRPSFSG